MAFNLAPVGPDPILKQKNRLTFPPQGCEGLAQSAADQWPPKSWLGITMNSNHAFLPCLTSELPGIGGVLKKEPEDFVVEEIPAYEPVGEGQHLFFNAVR